MKPSNGDYIVTFDIDDGSPIDCYKCGAIVDKVTDASIADEVEVRCLGCNDRNFIDSLRDKVQIINNREWAELLYGKNRLQSR